jgi:hypothetical protein
VATEDDVTQAGADERAQLVGDLGDVARFVSSGR